MEGLEKTPEQQWEKVKQIVFVGECPKEIDDLVKKGFAESIDDSEKWGKLAIVMLMLKTKSDNGHRSS